MIELWQGNRVGFWRIASFPDQECLFSTWDMGVTLSLFQCQSPWAYLVKSHMHVLGLKDDSFLLLCRNSQSPLNFTGCH